MKKNNMSDLYQEIILDHAHHPHNQGVLDHPTHTVRDANASCGDMVEMQFEVADGVIKKVAWRGVGCAISTASTSILSDLLIGKRIEEAKKMTEKELLSQLGMDTILPTREKCLLLPLRILQKLA